MTLLGLLLAAAACREAPREAVRIVPQLDPVQPRRVAFAPGGNNQLLVVEATGLVGMWNVDDPAHPVRTAWIPAGAVDAGFTADGREIVTAGWDGRVRWWDTAGQLLRTSAGAHASTARAVAIGDAVVVSGGEDGALQFWNHDGTARHDPIAAHEGFVVSVAVAPSGEIVSAGTDQIIRLWSPDASSPSGYSARVLHQEAKPRPTLAHLMKMDVNMGWDHAVAFAPGGNALAAAAFDGIVRLWSRDDWSRASGLNVPNGHVRALAWAPRGERLVAGGFNGSVARWDADGTRRGTIATHPQPVLSVAFSPDGTRLATTSIDDRVRLWSADGKLIAELRAGAKPPLTAVALTQRGPLFVSSDASGTLWSWRIDGSPGARLGSAPPGGALALAVATDGAVFAGGNHGLARIFASNGALMPKTTLASYIDAAAYSPNGDLIAIAGTAGRVELLNGNGGSRTPTFRTCSEKIYGIAFSPTAETLAILCHTGEIRLWTLDGKLAGSLLEAGAGAARGLAFGSTGELLASGRIDGDVGFWSLPQPRLRDQLAVGLSIDQVGLHRGGSWVLANGSTILFFDLDRRLVATALATESGVVAFTPQGALAGSRGAERLVRAFRADGSVLTAGETTERLAPEQVVKAIHPS